MEVTNIFWPASRLKTDESNRLVTDTQIAAWNGKAAANHTHTIANVTGLQTALDGKAASSHNHDSAYAAKSHTHTKSQITDFPASLKNPNSIVIKVNSGKTEGTDLFTYDGSAAKTIDITASAIGAAAASHSHAIANVTGLQTALDGKAASAHTHNKSQITDFPSTMKNPTSVIIKLNSGKTEGTDLFTYDGSTAKTIDITPAGIGAAASSHTHSISNITNLQSTLDGKAAASHSHAIANVTGLQTALDGKAASSHTHTKANITDFPTTMKNPSSIVVKLNGGTTEGTNLFTYDGSAAKSINITASGIGAAAASHSHSIANVTNLQTTLDGKAAKSHTHGDADITGISASKITGVISIDHLPQGALDRLVKVDNDTARFKLTTNDVQLGDTVKVVSTGLMYYVVDESKLNAEAGYEPYTAGAATSVPWTGVTGKPSTFTPSSHTHTIANITNLQTTLDGKAAASHTHSIANITNLQTTLNGKAAASHTHTKANITDFPTTMKNPTSVTIKLNGGTTEGTNMYTYDGSAAKSINITPSAIGAAASSHSHAIANVTGLQDALNGKAASSHSHAIANVTGLQDALNGKAASSHSHSIANITNLQTTLDSKVSNAPTAVTNWNSATNAGFYYAAKGAANAPESTLGYFGQVCKSTTSIMQVIYPEGASGDIKQYMRRGTISGSTVTWETNWACLTYALS